MAAVLMFFVLAITCWMYQTGRGCFKRAPDAKKLGDDILNTLKMPEGPRKFKTFQKGKITLQQSSDRDQVKVKKIMVKQIPAKLEDLGWDEDPNEEGENQSNGMTNRDLIKG